VLAAVARYSPLTKGETDHLLARLNDTVHATIYGSVVVAFVQGALGGFMFWRYMPQIEEQNAAVATSMV